MKHFKANSMENKPSRSSWGKRLAAYVLSVLVLANPVVPALADILSNSTIEQDFRDNPLYIPAESSSYQFRTPAFIEWPSSNTQSLESVYQQLIQEHTPAISAPTYVPIGVGDITTIIPTYTRYNYIGTPAVQARYVRAQMVSLLGRNIFKYTSETAQLNALYNNAIRHMKTSGAPKYGEKLNLDQEASGLANDLIWPELRTINGKPVIVPVVYLTAGTVAQYRVTSTEQEIAGNASFGNLTVYNSDLKADRDSFLDIANDLRLTNSTLTSEGALKITAGGHFDNASSIINTKGDLAIGAKSIRNRTIVYRYDLGHEQGTRYGEIADLGATEGSVVLTAHDDIVFEGANANASNGGITLDAGGDIKIGTQELHTVSTNRYGNGKETRSQISFLQSHITAEDTIKLMADGEIILDAAEIVSDKGHIELLAGLGITVINASEEYRSQAKGKFGKKTTVEESAYQTVALRSILNAGQGVTLSSAFGDITLQAADINTTSGTSVNAKNGSVNMLMTVETDHYSYNSVKEGTFTTTVINKGHSIETGISNSIVGGFSVEALNGINIQYEGDHDLDFTQPGALDAQLDDIVRMNPEAMGWIDVVRTHESVNWSEVSLEHREWYDKNTSLSPAFAAVVAIAVAVATQGAAAGLAGSITGSLGTVGSTAFVSGAVNAGVTSFISQASLAVANGAVDGDISGALEDFASDETLKSIGVSMLTAGVLAEIDASFFGEISPDKVDTSLFYDATDKLSLTGQAAQAVTHSVVQSGIRTLANGGDWSDFGEGFVQSVAQQGINSFGKHMAGKIKGAFDNSPESMDVALKYISHAGVGCIMGSATASLSGSGAESGCASGAGGAVVGELIGSAFRNTEKAKEANEKLTEFMKEHGLTDPSQVTQDIIDQATNDIGQTVDGLLDLQQRGINLARFGSALAAFVAGADAEGINIAEATGKNAAENNALFLIPAAIFLLKAVDIALTAKEYHDLAEDLASTDDNAEKEKILLDFFGEKGTEFTSGLLLEAAAKELVKRFIPGKTTFEVIVDFLKEHGVFPRKYVDQLKNWYTKRLARQCFVAGTLIHTQQGLKPIETLKVGELVLTKNDSSGHQTWKPIAQTFVNQNKEIYQLNILDEKGNLESLGTTKEHPFWVKDIGWMPVSELKKGDQLTSSSGHDLTVFSVVTTGEFKTTYNFEVEEYHTYFVGDVGVWVHNQCKIEVVAGKNIKSHYLDHKKLLEDITGKKYPKWKQSNNGEEFLGDLSNLIDDGEIVKIGETTFSKGQPVAQVYDGKGITLVLKENGEYWTLLESGVGRSKALLDAISRGN